MKERDKTHAKLLKEYYTMTSTPYKPQRAQCSAGDRLYNQDYQSATILTPKALSTSFRRSYCVGSYNSQSS